MKRLILKYLPLGTLLFAIPAAIFFAIAFLCDYEESVASYFARGSMIPVLALVFAGIAFAVGIVAACIRSGSVVPTAPLWSFAPVLLAYLIGAYLYFPTKTAGGVLLILGAIYPLLTMLPFGQKKVNLTAIAGFFSMATMVYLVASYYFDMTLEMNAPLKISVQMGLLCAMLYLTVELRSLLGRTIPRLFLLLTSLVIAVGSLPACSVILAYLTGKTTHRAYVAGAVLTLGVFLTACIRLTGLVFAKEKQEEETV